MSESDKVFSFTSYTELSIDSPVALQTGQEAGTLLTPHGCKWIGEQCLCYSNLCLAGKKCWTEKHSFPYLLFGVCALVRLFLLCYPREKKVTQRQQIDVFVLQFCVVGQRWSIQSLEWNSVYLLEKVLHLLFTIICFDTSALHYPSDETFGFHQASPWLPEVPWSSLQVLAGVKWESVLNRSLFSEIFQGWYPVLD